MENNNTLILTQGWLDSENGKTAHGLIRASERFKIVGVVDFKHAGEDAGEVLDGKKRNIPIFESLEKALETPLSISYLIIGVAVAGGRIPEEMLDVLHTAIRRKLHIVNGLHEKLNEKPEFINLAKEYGVTLIDVRRVKAPNEMRYWSGEIQRVTTPRIAVLGMDCAVGKRTTSRMLVEACRAAGIKAEMISTGQTGWMQDGRFGFMLDSTLNDFVTGELETQILKCYDEAAPDVMFLNGQSALRNPIGPCGAEFLVSGRAKYAILQAMPSRKYYEGTEDNLKVRIPSVKSEIQLIKMYGTKVIAVTLNTHGLTLEKARKKAGKLQKKLGIPVVLPLEDGVGALVEAIREEIF
jgi:uncharacterized NAD-dependent epimerase/dehydratase family protein